MPTPFEYISAINEKKDLEYESDYNPWMVNRGLSFHVQTIHYANKINELYSLDKDLQYNFYLHAIEKNKRYYKWEKKEKPPEEILAIQNYFNINKDVAEEYFELLTKEQIDEITTKKIKGGKS